MPHTILAVDDEPAGLRAVQRTLAESCRVLTAASGAAACAVLAAEPVALMVVDQRMPDMLGTQLLARTAASHPDIVRLLLTGYTEIDTLVDAINAGHVYHYLTKPWEPAQLRLAVYRGLEHFEAEMERQRLLRELRQACSRLQREAEQKGRLLTLAAHELGTPLHVLVNSLDLLAGCELPADACRWIATARRNSDWLGRGLAQMMAGGRWQQRLLPLRPRPTDVDALLAGMCARLEAAALAAQRRLTIEYRCCDDLPLTDVDAVWFERAVTNLMSNAVRFTADGGAIQVCIRAEASELSVAVADSGVGIDADHLDEMFEPFSAAGGDVLLHTSGGLGFGARGLGLGLAIARAVAEQHGGSLTAFSEKGQGSCFKLSVPLHP
jgi:signal transduction histidine kinase